MQWSVEQADTVIVAKIQFRDQLKHIYGEPIIERRLAEVGQSERGTRQDVIDLQDEYIYFQSSQIVSAVRAMATSLHRITQRHLTALLQRC